MSLRKFRRFREYIWLACEPRQETTLIGPRTETPPMCTVSPAFVSSQFPPFSAIRSTTTEPGCMASTMALVTRTGAFLPGTPAVVITTSLSDTALSMAARWRARNSSLTALA